MDIYTIIAIVIMPIHTVPNTTFLSPSNLSFQLTPLSLGSVWGAVLNSVLFFSLWFMRFSIRSTSRETWPSDYVLVLATACWLLSTLECKYTMVGIWLAVVCQYECIVQSMSLTCDNAFYLVFAHRGVCMKLFFSNVYARASSSLWMLQEQSMRWIVRYRVFLWL